MKEKKISRRRFLVSATTAATFTLVPRQVLGGNTAPSEKVNVAIIDMGGQGIVNMKQLFKESDARVMTEAARKAGIATQLGKFGHSGEDICLAFEWIWDGAIGEVHDIHSWTTTGARRWTSLTDRPQETPPVPAGFDWQK